MFFFFQTQRREGGRAFSATKFLEAAMDAATEGLEETGAVRALRENKLEGAEGRVVIVAVMEPKVRL